MANNTARWDQSQHFLDATSTTIAPGGATAYAIPRRIGSSPTDVTSFHPGQQHWTKHSMPDILYQLGPTAEWHVFRASRLPPQKVDANGDLVFEAYPEGNGAPRPLLGFKVLPDKIGTNEEWWYFEAVRRIDPRVRWIDITMRMESGNRSHFNAIQLRASRTWRPKFFILSWHTKGRFATNNNRASAIRGMLSAAQIATNTTRGSTPGLINPSLGEQGGRIPLPDMRGLGEARPRKEPSSPPLALDSDEFSSASDDEDMSTSPAQKQDDFEDVMDLDTLSGRRILAESCPAPGFRGEERPRRSSPSRYTRRSALPSNTADKGDEDDLDMPSEIRLQTNTRRATRSRPHVSLCPGDAGIRQPVANMTEPKDTTDMPGEVESISADDVDWHSWVEEEFLDPTSEWVDLFRACRSLRSKEQSSQDLSAS